MRISNHSHYFSNSQIIRIYQLSVICRERFVTHSRRIGNEKFHCIETSPEVGNTPKMSMGFLFKSENWISRSGLLKIVSRIFKCRKHMALIVFTLVWCEFAGAATDTVATSIELGGTASYAYEEHHPTKIGETICGGKPSDFSFEEAKKSEETLQDNMGTKTLYNSFNGTDSRLGKMANQTVDWKFAFDKEDYSFHIKFSKLLGSGHEFYRRKPCNTKSWYYKVNSANSKVKTSVNLVVPQNVFFVEIERIVNKELGIEAIFTARNIRSKSTNWVTVGSGEIRRPVHYFYVKPGDEITLELDFKEENTNIDLIADLKVTFLGYNRCDSIIKRTLGDDKESFSVSRIMSALTKGFSSNSKGDISSDSQQSLRFLGCLTARPTIQKLLFENDKMDVNSIIEALEGINEEIDVRRSQNRTEPFDHILDDISYIARYSISQSAVESAQALCKKYIFSPNPGEVSLISGYLFIRQRLDRILSLLKIGESQFPSTASEARRLTDDFKLIQSQTENPPREDRLQKTLALIEEYESRNFLGVLEETLDEANFIPPIPDSRKYMDFRLALVEFYSASIVFNRFFQQSLESLFTDENTAVDFHRIEIYLSNIEAKGKTLKLSLFAFMKDFEGRNANQFAKGLTKIQDHQHRTESEINGKYDGFFRSLFDFFPNTATDKFIKCLESPIGSSE